MVHFHLLQAGEGADSPAGAAPAAPATPSTNSAQRAKLFWDLDNVRPASLEQALLTAHRLRAALGPLAGARPELVAFANPHTMGRLAGRQGAGLLAAALQLVDSELVPVKLRRWGGRAGVRLDSGDMLGGWKMTKATCGIV